MMRKNKKRGKGKSASAKSKKETVGKGYTKEIQAKLAKIKKLYADRAADEENYKENKIRFAENKKRLVEELNKLQEKKKSEKENLTKLINYVKEKK